MASSYRLSQSESANNRHILRSKPTNDVLFKPNSRSRAQPVSDMSPEARKAMLLAREDSKENVTARRSNSRADADQKTVARKPKETDNNNNSSNNKSNGRNGQPGARTTDTVRHNQKTNSLQAPGALASRIPPRLRKMTAVSQGATTVTTRSRSTLSRTDPTYSISDHNESCYNYGNMDAPKSSHLITDSPHNNDNTEEDNNNNNNNHEFRNHQTEPLDDDEDEDNIGDNSDNENGNLENLEEDQSLNPKSFVLALDRALEDNQISRLRGDITDHAGLSEPGTVRALDGGRLANAQEVVVNVCHDDDRELIFHDEDDESLDNAKTISEIRINIWMKYNEGFQPDTITDDLDIGVSSHPSRKQNSTVEKTQLKVPGTSGLPPRGRENRSSTPTKTSTASRNSNSSQGGHLRREASNNSSNALSKSRASSITRDNSSTRIGSAISTDGSKRSTLSSGKKESYLRRKIKT